MGDYRVKAPADRDKLDDAELVRAAVEEWWEYSAFSGRHAEFRNHVAGLTPGQLAVFATYWVQAAIHKGGFRAFMRETEGFTRAEVLEAYERLGMTRAADILRGLETMPATESEFAKLYGRWYEARKGLEAAQAAYIRAHPDEFFLTP
jgi:hypothetical protein